VGGGLSKIFNFKERRALSNATPSVFNGSKFEGVDVVSKREVYSEWNVRDGRKGEV
jgi:hypothetical protein